MPAHVEAHAVRQSVHEFYLVLQICFVYQDQNSKCFVFTRSENHLKNIGLNKKEGCLQNNSTIESCKSVLYQEIFESAKQSFV